MFVHGATVSVVSFVEIIAYCVFCEVRDSFIFIKLTYLWQNVVTPIFINVIAHIAVRLINASAKTSDNLKNSSVIYGAPATAFVVSLFHRDYIVALCAFVFPIILSAMYNDKKLLKQSLCLSVISLITMTVLFFEHKLDLTTSINIFILYGYIAVSFLSGIISIKFSQRNFSVINEQLIVNNDLESKVTLYQMTGLYNHKAFYAKLEMLIADARENMVDGRLAMVDVDDFKKVNDVYGHNAGDSVFVFLRMF